MAGLTIASSTLKLYGATSCSTVLIYTYRKNTSPADDACRQQRAFGHLCIVWYAVCACYGMAKSATIIKLKCKKGKNGIVWKSNTMTDPKCAISKFVKFHIHMNAYTHIHTFRKGKQKEKKKRRRIIICSCIQVNVNLQFHQAKGFDARANGTQRNALRNRTLYEMDV